MNEWWSKTCTLFNFKNLTKLNVQLESQGCEATPRELCLLSPCLHHHRRELRISMLLDSIAALISHPLGNSLSSGLEKHQAAPPGWRRSERRSPEYWLSDQLNSSGVKWPAGPEGELWRTWVLGRASTEKRATLGFEEIFAKHIVLHAFGNV